MKPLSPATLDRLREAYQAATPQPPAGCPDPDTLFEAARGELSAAATRGLIDHTATCSACAEAWRLAHAVIEAGDPRETPAAAGSRSPRSWRWALVPAGALLIAAVAIFVDWRDTGTGLPAYREATDLPLRALPASEVVSRERCVLRWTPASDGARYSIRVTTEDLRAIDQARGLEAPEHEVPSAQLTSVARGGKIVWQVEARLPDGRVIGSPTFVSTVR